MWIFLLLSVPLSFLIINSTLIRGSWDIPFALWTAVKGFIIAIAGLLTFWASRFGLDFSMSLPNLYHYTLIYGGSISISMAVILLWVHTLFREKSEHTGHFREYLLLWAVFFTAFSIKDCLSLDSGAGLTDLFLMPLARIGFMILLALAFDRLHRLKIQGRLVILFLLLLVTALLPFIWIQDYLIKPLLLIGFTLIFTGLSILLLILDKKGKLPYGFEKRP